MKKIKLFLLAAMLIGTASAFTTTKHMRTDLWVPDKTGHGITLQEGQNQDGSCDVSFLESCYYENEALTIPADGAPQGRFVYP